MPSVKETIQKINTLPRQNPQTAVSPEPESVNETEVQEIIKQPEISTEQINSLYSNFIEKQKDNHPRLYSALKGQTLIPDDLNCFELVLQNQALLDEYKLRIKSGLIAFILESTGLTKLELNERIADVDKMDKPKLFNDKEKLRVMAEKNPAILELKSKFNLDFD